MSTQSVSLCIDGKNVTFETTAEAVRIAEDLRRHNADLSRKMMFDPTERRDLESLDRTLSLMQRETNRLCQDVLLGARQ